MTSFERDIAAQLRHLTKTATMWGSPEELEAVAQHFTHVWLSAQTPGWRFEETFALWQKHGSPFAADPETHAALRTRFWAEHVETARVQVVTGFVTLWAELPRHSEREALLAPWVETLLDAPHLAGLPDRLNAILFALMGFVAAEPAAYVELLRRERERIVGSPLRGLHIVAPPGPTEAALTYGAPFSSWQAVRRGVETVLEALEQSGTMRT